MYLPYKIQNCSKNVFFVSGLMVWLSPGLLVLVALFLEDFGGGILGVKALSRRRQSQFSILHHRVRRSRSTTASEAMASKLGPAFHTQPPSIYTFSNDSGKAFSRKFNVCGDSLKIPPKFTIKISFFFAPLLLPPTHQF